MTTPWESHTIISSAQWARLVQAISPEEQGKYTIIDGKGLDISTAVATARLGRVQVLLQSCDNERPEKRDESVKAVHAELANGRIIYDKCSSFYTCGRSNGCLFPKV